MLCIFAPFSSPPFQRWKNHLFSLTFLPLNSQPRLFIYFIFFPFANPQHNLTKHKKRFLLRPQTAPESLFLYLSIISFDEAKCVRHGKFVLCVMKMPKPFLFLSPLIRSFTVLCREREENYSCPCVREIA